MKKIIILLAIFALLTGCSHSDTKVSDKIIESINNQYDENGEALIAMNEITDFNWDRLIVFNTGSSNEEISSALGFKYDFPTDLMSGIVFAYKGKIVYREEMPSYPEKPSRLELDLGAKQGVTCLSVAPKEATFIGIRDKVDDKYYYGIKYMK